jgi:hypothetical protein
MNGIKTVEEKKKAGLKTGKTNISMTVTYFRLRCWIIIELDASEVVGCGYQLPGMRSGAGVHVSTVSSFRPYTDGSKV